MKNIYFKITFSAILMFLMCNTHMFGQTEYRYLRFSATDVSNYKVMELEWIAGLQKYPEEAMTSDNSAGVVASTTAYAAFEAFDDVITTGGIYFGDTPNSVTLDLVDKTVAPTAFRIWKSGFHGLNAFILYGSNDGENWEVLLDVSNASGNWTDRTFTIIESDSELAIDNNLLYFDSNSNTADIGVTSNIDWNVDIDVDWITANPDAGSNDGSVSLNIAANPSDEQREANVGVVGPDIAKYAKVYQSVNSANDGVMEIGTNFWNVAWSPRGDYFKTGVDWSTVENPWAQKFLDEVSFYTVFRFMDFDRTNNSDRVSFDERAHKTDDHYTTGTVAYEWMIDLCNRTNTDIWVCLPHKSNPDYWTQLATLIKNNLNEDLKVYVEYSNEVWNGAFQQYQYSIDQGVANNLPGGNEYYQGGAFYVAQSVKIFDAFEDVFGADAMGTKVYRVCSMSGNYDITEQGFANILDSEEYNPNGQKVDKLAIAPYVGGNLDGSDPDIRQLFHDNIEYVYNTRVLPPAETAEEYGMDLITYEGGQHLLTNADQWSSNPDIYDEYLYMLELFENKISMFNHYTHSGVWQSGGAWGAKTSINQSIDDAHKYRALVDYANVNTLSVDMSPSIIPAKKVYVYPNPLVNRNLTIQLKNYQMDGNPIDMKIISIDGRTIKQYKIDSDEFTVQRSDFPASGMYIISLSKKSGGNDSFKLMVQ